jgi:hypothetical protein
VKREVLGTRDQWSAERSERDFLCSQRTLLAFLCRVMACCRPWSIPRNVRGDLLRRSILGSDNVRNSEGEAVVAADLVEIQALTSRGTSTPRAASFRLSQASA